MPPRINDIVYLQSGIWRTYEGEQKDIQRDHDEEIYREGYAAALRDHDIDACAIAHAHRIWPALRVFYAGADRGELKQILDEMWGTPREQSK